MDAFFNSKNIIKCHEEITLFFVNYFLAKGYREQKSVSIISKKDHSVRFTGSTTNVFKTKIFSNNKIIEPGLLLIQKCLRTQNSIFLSDDQIFPEWGSYFTEIGLVAPASNLKKITVDTLNFFSDILKIEKSRIILRACSSDKDILDCIKDLDLSIEINGLAKKCYRHKYGVEKAMGRNFNIAIKNSITGQIKDIGNIVIIEMDNNIIAVEMGFGISTLLAGYYNLSNSIEASVISSVIPIEKGYKSKFSDALSSVVVMLRENIRPTGRGEGRILRDYLFGLKYLAKKLNISIEEIMIFATAFEELEFKNTRFVCDKILLYLGSDFQQ
ncbi:MAG: hypothetical protein Q8O59_01920 [bacterium]|nr:hypothetical protein [bacterium]